jgi:HEAT repeat protein
LKALRGRAFENETANRILCEISGADAGYDTDAGWANKQVAIKRWEKIVSELKEPETPTLTTNDRARLDRRARFLIAVLGQHQFLFMEQARRTLSGMNGIAVRHLAETFAGDALGTNQQLRAYAIQALGIIANGGYEGAVSLLADRLQADPSPVVRSRAATALGGLSSTPDLTSALDDEDLGVRVSAVLALGLTTAAKSDPLIARFRALAIAKDTPDVMGRAAAFALLRWSSANEAARLILVDCLSADSISLRAEGAIFIRSWLGDLQGYDPDVLPAEQATVIEKWATRLVDF